MDVGEGGEGGAGVPEGPGTGGHGPPDTPPRHPSGSEWTEKWGMRGAATSSRVAGGPAGFRIHCFNKFYIFI